MQPSAAATATMHIADSAVLDSAVLEDAVHPVAAAVCCMHHLHSCTFEFEFSKIQIL